MKKYLIIIAVIVAGLGIIFGLKNSSSPAQSSNNTNTCAKYSNKDGYTGCQSVVKGKEKLCKFKIDNKINESTQQMEFTYTCSPK